MKLDVHIKHAKAQPRPDAPCQWCGLAEHGGNCRAEWTKLAAEKAAQGLQLIVPNTSICPWCRRCVVRHCVACQAARMVEVAL